MTRNLGAARANFPRLDKRFALCLLLALLTVVSVAQSAPLQLWYWHHSYLTSDSAVATSKTLIDRAAKCGYTGVAFWDESFAYLADSFWPKSNLSRMREVMQYASSKGMRVMATGAPFGWSNGALAANGNMAEAQQVIGTRFVVDKTGRALHVVNSLAPLHNAGFEEGRAGWFDTSDEGIGISQVAHSGKYAAVVVDAQGNARFRQRISLTPWRQYHLSLWFKSSHFRGPAVVEVMDWWHRKESRFYAAIDANGTRDWTRLDFLFDSQSSNWAYLYFGVWGRTTGTLWFDDIQLEETAPVYVTRRAGTPLEIYDPEDPRTIYREGADFHSIFDPTLSPPRAEFRDVYHQPVQVTLPTGSRLRPGQTVAMDFYAVFPLPGDQQVGMCLTDPAVFRWMEENTEILKTLLPTGDPVLLSYDEMRQMNSCGSCRAKHMTAGELLAWNVERTVKLYRSLLPGSELLIWNDMFDPYQNAKKHYFYVEGDLAGSWKGLAGELVVLNWNHERLPESLRWFSGADSRQRVAHRQIIASYYDSGNADSAQTDLRTAQGIRGIEGLMYITWRDDYSQLEGFAESARKAWGAYQDSVGKNPKSAKN